MGTKADFGATRKQAEDAGLLGGSDYYKYKEGDNRFRLMSICLPHQSEFQGRPNFKWLCYVLDRRDGKIKVHFMPHKIYKAIEALQINPDYAFQEVPMPYDVTVCAKGAGTKEVEYSLIPARRETPLTETEDEAFSGVKSIQEVQDALKQKKEQQGNTPTPPVDHQGGMTDDDVPF